MIRLFALSYDDPAYVSRLDACSELLWDVAIGALHAGASVVLDWNFWSRDRRADAKRRAADAGFSVRVHWITTPLDVAISRAATRSAEDVPNTHAINEEGVRHSAAIFEPPDESEDLPIVTHS